MAAKLVGMEDVVMGLFGEDEPCRKLMNFCTELALTWTRCIRSRGFNAVVFDSMAAPPILSPEIYRNQVLPLHQSLFEAMSQTGQEVRELVIGGDTTSLAAHIAQSGASQILCDYACDAQAFAKALPASYTGRVRRNIDPVALTDIPHDILSQSFGQDLRQFKHPVAGTGILPYEFLPDCLKEFMEITKQKRSRT
jgi:uroporphyrinogen-III decarboxylase